MKSAKHRVSSLEDGPGDTGSPLSVSASNLVVAGVIAALETGQYAPGQRLVEADLRLRFGVSRNTVREALQRLASEGVIELSPNKGASIRQVPLDQALQTLELTELLLGLAARGAARGISAAGADLLIRQALGRLSAADSQDDDRPFIKARAGFYSALLRIGQNHELRRIFPGVQVHVLRAQYHLTRAHRRLQADYAEIGAAVLAGDAERAEGAARSHVQRLRTLIETDQKTQEQPHA